MTATLNAAPETCHWGYFEATRPAALTIKSGQDVIINTVSGAPNCLPPEGFHVPPELYDIHKAGPPPMPGPPMPGTFDERSRQLARTHAGCLFIRRSRVRESRRAWRVGDVGSQLRR